MDICCIHKIDCHEDSPEFLGLQLLMGQNLEEMEPEDNFTATRSPIAQNNCQPPPATIEKSSNTGEPNKGCPKEPGFR